jgi:LuxR family maltose regulon positive regulatory protein
VRVASAEQRRLSSVPVRTEPKRAPFEVVESKLQVPALRSGTVSRTALVNRLKAADASVVAVTAPAGYGKTTLLAQWTVRDARPFAWVSIDERDKDPVLVLRYLASALDAIAPLDPGVFDALAEPEASVWTSAIPRLGAALSACPTPLVIVLDDAHLLRSRRSLEAVLAVADHLPQASMLVLAGRSTPRLPMAALRAAGRLFELGTGDLALSSREGQLLLYAAGVDLPLGEATELTRRCEGWAAALYLAALAVEETGAAEAPFGGGDRHIADYIRSEYLTRLRPGDLRFLTRTAVLDRMSGPLCDAVLQGTGSGRTLQRLEGTNLFLVPLDRERHWYRYHQLFRDLLRRELEEREPALAPELHRRAADWFEAEGDLELALEHADAAGDTARAARLLTAIALPLYFAGRLTTIEGWLARFDDPTLLRRYPGVALQGSWVYALRGRPAEAKRWLELAESGTFRGRLPDGSSSLQAWIAVVRAAMCGDGVYQMIVDAESALSLLPRDSQMRPSALVTLGVAYMLLDQAERADGILATAASEAARLGATDTQVVAISERSVIASNRGAVEDAESFALEAQALLAEHHLATYPTSALALASSARVALRHGRWDDARARLSEAEELRPLLRRSGFPWLSVQTRLELARAYLALRDTRSVRALLAEIRETLRERPHVGVLADEVASLEREVTRLPVAGEPAAAGLTAAELRLLPYLATHLSFREIGQQLYVSRNTVKTQAISVYRKLGVSSRSDAIERATDLGLVEPGSH